MPRTEETSVEGDRSVLHVRLGIGKRSRQAFKTNRKKRIFVTVEGKNGFCLISRMAYDRSPWAIMFISILEYNKGTPNVVPKN